MKKYIEEIIEIILENVSCVHQEIDEFPRGPKFDDVTYCLNDEKDVIEKCLKVIPMKRSEIMEEFIEKKAREFFSNLPLDAENAGRYLRDFIRSLLKEKL